MLNKLKELIIGKPHNPLDQSTREKIALTAFFAWVGLGADGLSSSCYGPEQAYLALGKHVEMGLFLALATALTVFLISFAYNQVIELFPNGGGGYKVATKLLGKRAGLVTGAALIVDYILTIVISVASSCDAVFSLLPLRFLHYKLTVETALIVLLVILNLRGMKESIKFLLPIFIGFVVTHFSLIVYGVYKHESNVPTIIHHAYTGTTHLAMAYGVFFTIALFLHAYSLGGGTYTGLEAVSNNVNTLTEPRVRTGKWTMFYMAISLSFTAGGILLLYMLWHVHLIPGQTLNAIAFRNILGNWGGYAHPVLVITLFFEAGLLFISANTGFLGGPAVLANLAMDHWVPNRFRNLSSRLVKQNGVILFGFASLVILFATDGHVAYLVVLYSVNVFLAFMISIFGLCKYWVTDGREHPNWLRRFILSSIGFVVCLGILLVLVISKFFGGGMMGIFITFCIIAVCWYINNYYEHITELLKSVDKLLIQPLRNDKPASVEFDETKPTAVLFVGPSRGAAMHTLLWIQRLFPNHFKNIIFVSVGVVDVESYGGAKALDLMRQEVESNLDYFKNFALQSGLAARTMEDYGTDPVTKLVDIATSIDAELPNCIYFASKLVLENVTWITRQLQNETAFTLQRRLHLKGLKMVILPMKLE